jgi:photosystem II stability/assembly factor-like uncharacterized protein
MNRTILVLALCLAAASMSAFADGFNDVHSPDGVSVWAVGAAGTVFRSTDGGATWSRATHGAATLRTVWTREQRIWIAGDGGTLQRSTDGGQNWTFSSINGGVTIRSLTFADDLHGWAVGDNGTIASTIDGGATWTPRASGRTRTLYAVAASDSAHVYAAGDAGTLLRSVDGGATWLGAAQENAAFAFTAIAASGVTVMAAGANGVCLRSTDAGASWLPVDLFTDVRSDIGDVHMISSDSAVIVGGGGFIRRTADGGAHFRYGQHGLHARLTRVWFSDPLHGWACSDLTNAILRTSDGGATWSLPTGTTVLQSWVQRMSASSSIGNTFMVNPLDKKRLYVALGRFIYMSADMGETWTQTATISATSGSTHSFYISPKDTNLYVVAFTGGGDRIMRSTDRGATWTSTIVRNFSSYGMPLEMDAAHPDTLLFAPEDGLLYRSLDFGAKWDTLSAPGFASPCDIQIVRDSAGIVWVGDSSPSRISRSTDGGVTWTLVFSGSSSEIPTIANVRLDNGQGFATAWGSGGLQKTTNFGQSWTTVTSTGSTWGVDIAHDDPTVVMFGVYGGGMTYLSTNSGSTFAATPIGGSNYAILAYDRGTFFAQQSSGVWKLSTTYGVPVSNQQTLALVSPNGGESLQYGSVQPVLWTSGNLNAVKLEYRTGPGQPWQLMTASTPAAAGSFAWSVPAVSTTHAAIRISNAADTVPADSSEQEFTIGTADVALSKQAMVFGPVGIGSGKRDTLVVSNAGTATLVVYSVSTTGTAFIPGRTSLTIPAGGSDTLGVYFLPDAVMNYSDTLLLATSAPGGTVAVGLEGSGVPVLHADEDPLPATFRLAQNYPNPFNGETRIVYSLPPGQSGGAEGVVLKLYDLLGRDVMTLVHGIQLPGEHAVTVHAGELPSGVYVYRLQAGAYVAQRKMVLLK